MIVVEEILEEIFTQLPAYVVGAKSYPIKYEWGSEKDLALFLQTIAGNKYPLVWLVQGKQTDNISHHNSERRLRLILAKNSNQKTNRNPTVFKTDFKDCLNPLLKNVLTALNKSGVTTILNNGQVEVDKRANYIEESTEKSKTFTIDYWNAIIIDLNVRFQEKANGETICINTIKF